MVAGHVVHDCKPHIAVIGDEVVEVVVQRVAPGVCLGNSSIGSSLSGKCFGDVESLGKMVW